MKVKNKANKEMEEYYLKQRVHVVVLPYPSQGHINPLLQFAKRLASKGVKATLATTHYTVKSIYVANICIEPISDGFDDGGYAQAQSEELFLESFKANGSKTLSQLIQKYQNTKYPINCVVYDSYLPWALDVAKQHGLYGAAFFTNSAAVCSIFCRIHYGLISLPLKPENIPLFIPGLPPFNFSDLPSFLRLPPQKQPYLRMQLGQFPNLEIADWVFANTFEELEGEVAKGIKDLWPWKLIGPMVPSAYLDGRIEDDKGYGASLWKPLNEEYIKWLETNPPKSIVYVSFGSMVTLTKNQMEEIALGLKQSGFNFVWVVRESERQKLPKTFFDSSKEKGLIVTWCNQLEMLANEAIGCFVTHCGWNSTLEALSLGVPMVGMPQWADQFTNAKFVEEVWKIGVRAKEDEEGIVRKNELQVCLKQVMEVERSQDIKKNANKWKEIAKKSLSEGGSSDMWISKFVDYLMCGGETKKTIKG